MLLGSSIVLPDNMPRHSAYGLAKVMIAWRSSTPRVTEATRSLPLVLAIANALSLPLVASIWDLMSSQVIGVSSLQTAFGLMVYVTTGVGAGQLHPGEVVGVDRRRPVGADREGPRQRRLEHVRGVGDVAVDVQGIEVLGEAGQCEPQVAAVLQGSGVLRIHVVGGADLGVASGRRRRLAATGARRERESGDEKGAGEASKLHADRL